MDLVPYIFHEQQEGNLCAQHCLNALLQGPYFTAIDLAELARQLDQREQDALGNSGSGAREVKSQNMDDSGFFSVQVLSHALDIWNVQIIPWGAKEVSDSKTEPEREIAFICNLDQHWYTLRRFGPSTQRWYDLNSMHSQPKHMSAIYLGMTLSQLEMEGYSIFVVRSLEKLTTDEAPDEKVESAAKLPPAPEVPATFGFLNERQEMERITRQRIKEHERAPSQQNVASSTTSSDPDTSNNNKRALVDQAGDKQCKRLSKEVLVTTPSFLPRCEADIMAATLPQENFQRPGTEGAKDALSSTGYRLGGLPGAAADTSALPPGFSWEDTDLGQSEGDGDAEWEMMQQAIAMSLQGSK
ncbi:Josephin-domain-containing protein [Gamsiella multidivaricata]|uniref:Josephin-domain-containing protein n=1 Tax=Gamsiella multidivaricata TaxID=101098 RepID=UPI0022208BEB|nr:Josephin-domain-containing protein [Gamsiella multidivaricata]KAG0362980.1 Ataxin-3 [Gamsiella multidivaricata]KAI7818896.1 Josephin-domain-containing protein [Gamsiella multidivaricata]